MVTRSLARLVVTALVAVGLATASAGEARGEAVGEQRVLAVLATWGPEPYSPADAQRVIFQETDAFIRTSSFGRTWLTGSVVGWAHVLQNESGGCETGRIQTAARQAALAQGVNPDTFTPVVFAFPRINCPWSGQAGGDVMLNGPINRFLVAHEFGHIFGAEREGPAWICAGRCRAVSYETPYSVMGRGWGDYSIIEKHGFGWARVERSPRDGEATVTAIDRPDGVHGLRITTAADQYWLEYRSPQPIFDYRNNEATPGIVLYGGTGPALGGPASDYPSSGMLLADPIGVGRPSVQAGEAFSVRGIFSVRVLATGVNEARIRFDWTDTTRPRAPRLTAPRGVVRGRVRVAWRPSFERASGVDRYEVRLDGGAARRVPVVREALGGAELPVPLRAAFRARPGRHRVTVAAVDRAGNRGPAAARSFRVR